MYIYVNKAMSCVRQHNQNNHNILVSDKNKDMCEDQRL